MRLKFTVEVELSHTTGKFVSKEDLRQAIIGDYLDSSPPDEIMVEDSQYTVDGWEVQEA